MKFTYCISFIILLFSSCSNDQNQVRQEAEIYADSVLQTTNYPKEIVGDWISNSLRIDVNADSAYQVYVAKGEWENKLNQRPIQTTFRPNNTYQIDYLSLQDSLFEKRQGIWNIFGDTLLLIEDNANYQYVIKMRRNYLQYQAQLDWDNDTEIDDTYTQIDQKVIKSD
ncbi:MAG: hypothetical protein ACI9XO_005045 [Paraglaciecola sp.]|jgi:hypothetical protein